LVCHRPHGDETTRLFRVAGALGGNDAGCRICHSTYVWGAGGKTAALHPNEMKAGMSHGDLPLVSVNGSGTGKVGCRSCHNPHVAVAGNPSLLRITKDQTPQMLCTTCHSNAIALAFTGHAVTGLAKAGLKDAAVCGPCHVVHGDANAVNLHRLWPKSLGSADVNDHSASTRCTACHRGGGPAKAPRIATHPNVVMQAIAAAQPDRSLPLFDPQGHEDPAGSIACGTCHLPHGQPMAKDETAMVGALTRGEQKAARLMLRSFRPPNLCTTCHGADGLRRFLYFHDPQRRSGPLATGPLSKS
jgi:predicted CXXCH cytochrome family protein